jgi:hypothetical protein
MNRPTDRRDTGVDDPAMLTGRVATGDSIGAMTD